VCESSYGALLPMVDQLDACLKKASDTQCELVKELFYSHLLPRLKRSIHPWNLPRELGGLGLEIGRTTYSQRKVAGLYFMTDEKVCNYPKEVPDYVTRVNRYVSELEESLRVDYLPRWQSLQTDVLTEEQSKRVFLEDHEDDLDISKYFIGAAVQTIGTDGYGRLLKDTLTCPWVAPISEDYDWNQVEFHPRTRAGTFSFN